MAGLTVSGPAMSAEIVPHQAMYRLSLQDIKIDAWVESAYGTMEVKITRDCFHYGLDRHIDFKIRYTDDRETHIVIEERLRESVVGISDLEVDMPIESVRILRASSSSRFARCNSAVRCSTRCSSSSCDCFSAASARCRAICASILASSACVSNGLLT